MKEKNRYQTVMNLYQMSRQFSKKLRNTAISAYSGQSAYMLILSFFPFFIFLLSLLKYTPLSEETLLSAIEIIFPVSFRSFMISLIDGIFQNQMISLLPVTVITALWLGSKSFLSLINGLNSVYEIEETRNYFVLRFWAVLYTILFAVLILATLTVLVFGNTLFFYLTKHFPIIEHILLPIISFRSLASFLIMLLFFTFLYKNIPNEKLRFADQLPGALLATTGWMGFSFLYSYYVDHISNYSSFYGTMTVIALLMVWLYACMYILFFGGLLNYLLKEYRVHDYLTVLKKQQDTSSSR